MREVPLGKRREANEAMKLLILFTNYGPYHIARLRGAQRALPNDEVIGLELATREATYPWTTNRDDLEVRLDSLHDGLLEEAGTARLSWKLRDYLNRQQPDALAICGYARPEMRLALRWAKRNGKIAVLMSESKSDDAPRAAWKERLKSCIVRRFDAGLVGGSQSKQYLQELGMPAERVFFGYDVVGNDDFRQQAEAMRSAGDRPVDKPYFLTVNRFVPRKNLRCVFEAYALYRQKVKNAPWSLVLIGSGEEEAALRDLAHSLDLPDVHFTGFLQQEEISRYMAFASCFIHASLQEQWGLVVNEAMACGLPVLVSRTCGCAYDLVREGCNGFTFEPTNTQELAGQMEHIAGKGCDLTKMGAASLEIIAQWGPDLFGESLSKAIYETMRR